MEKGRISHSLHGYQHAIALASSTNWYVGNDGGAWANGKLSGNMQLVSQREDLRLQGITGPKTGRDQSEKGDEKRAHRGTHHHLTQAGTPVFSDRTEFSVTTGDLFELSV